jgi:hypothetical protein
MAEYQAVTQSEHGHKTWEPLTNFKAFAGERTAPLVAAEFAKACVALPIAWVDNEGVFDPIALLGLQANENLLINAQGKWIEGYLPAHYRTQPFRLIQTGDEQLTLGVREDIDLVMNSVSGNLFFNEEGQLSKELNELVGLLQKVESNRKATALASIALNESGLLEPWSLAPKVYGEPKKLGGLYRVSQTALNSVDAETLKHIRDTGALAMAYCQQISEPLVQRLERLHEQRSQAKTKRSAHPADQQSFGLGDDEGISFGGMAGNDGEGLD